MTLYAKLATSDAQLVPLKSSSDQEWGRYSRFPRLKLVISNNSWFHVVGRNEQVTFLEKP